jgi:hypothetical protein
MREFRRIAAALVALSVPSIGSAADVAGLMKTVPVVSRATSKGLYDLERCFIETDLPSMPFVYSQPDRPERVLFVWDGTGGGLGGVAAAAQIDGLQNAKVTFWGREKMLRRIEPCFDTVYGQ